MPRDIQVQGGERFHHWVVVVEDGRDNNGSVMVHARCDCGTERRLPLSRLRSGHSKSCGCKRQELLRATLLHKYGTRRIASRANVRLCEEDFAYMAGFVDGEGCFSAGTSGVNFTLAVGQTDVRPLELFSAFSGNEISLSRQDTATNKKHAYHVAIGSWLVLRDLCQRLVGHLRIKRQHAEAILACEFDNKDARTKLATQLSVWNRTGLDAPRITTVPDTAPNWRDWSGVVCAYHAGLFDGEGCVHGMQAHRKAPYIGVTVGMVEPAALGEIALAFGKRVWHGHSSSGRNMRPSSRVSLTGYDGYLYLSLIRPYLLVKDSVADIYLDWFDGDAFQRQDAIAKLSALNHKGAREAAYPENQAYFVPLSSVEPQILERFAAL